MALKTMNNTLYLLRHGKTKVDKDVPISQWALTDFGKQQAQDVASNDHFKDIDIIITSAEGKAMETAQPLADALGKKIIQVAELSELDRDKGGFMDADVYEATAKEALTNRDVSVRNWETATHALERFSAAIDEINKQYEGKRILIVGHGYTMNLYFAKLLGELDKVHERMEHNDFCDWGIIKEGKIIKDLGEDMGRVGERLI
jgi:broad specificity phosphatase PhoE